MNNVKKLSLINYEGDCLTAQIDGENFFIKDQYGEWVSVLSRNDLARFLEGEFSISDSRGKSWNYLEVHEEAKPKLQDLVKFIERLPKFKVGDKAYKAKGYKFPCTIVSVFQTVSGQTRIVAEMDDFGLLHIFNEEQLNHYDNN